MKKNKGFTLTEVLIACGILSMFIGAVLTLYSNGSKMSNSTMWLQNTTNRLRNATRLISESIRKGSYPTIINYPKGITQSKSDCFKVQYKAGKILAKDTANGKNFLVVAECKPVRVGVEVKGSSKITDKGEIKYHIYSLSSKGELTYSRYLEKNITSVTDSMTRSIPSGKSNREYTSVLVTDVESIECNPKIDKRDDSPLEIIINCKMPRQITTRSETAVGTPNVEIINNLK